MLIAMAVATLACGGAESELAEMGPMGGPDAGQITPDSAPPSGVQPLRVMTFNIKHGEESSLEEVANTISESHADVVCLQEVDNESVRADGVFQSYRLGQLTGMASSFRESISFESGGSYGLAILSRFPIASSQKLLLTSGGEQRIAVAWKIIHPERGELTFINTHLGLDASEREVQMSEIVAAHESSEKTFLLGDLNAEPSELAPLQAAFDDTWNEEFGSGYTHPSGIPSRRIDYVLASPDWPSPTAAIVVETETSDHRPLLVEFP